jgi:hypothetical protein
LFMEPIRGSHGCDNTDVYKINSLFEFHWHNLRVKMAVFWVVAPCSLVDVYRRFRDACCLHQNDDSRSFLPLLIQKSFFAPPGICRIGNNTF